MSHILVFGATGMLGHTLCRVLSQNHSVIGTVRGHAKEYRSPLLNVPLYSYVDVNDMRTVYDAIKTTSPDVVINAIGIVKQVPDAANRERSILVNSLLPHKLASICKIHGAHLIQISTDCVFDGTQGGYRETDPTTATDLYGRTKALGEVINDRDLTLRTSIVGHELYPPHHGLLEWMLQQTWATVPGYTNAIFSGVTTIELARTIDIVIQEYPDLTGLYHVAAPPITKHDLLTMINATFDLGATIVPDASVAVDRSLNDDLFRTTTNIPKPSWQQMVDELYAEHPRYAERC